MQADCATAAAAAAPTIPCHVVEDHHDALPFWHLAMRRKRLAQQGITMVHIDAHPDLCVTEDMQADICFQPRALYDALDNSVGGIAEWIIPLVYEGHLDTIWWLRPPWADQFTDGTYALGVGKSQATGEQLALLRLLASMTNIDASNLDTDGCGAVTNSMQ
ncbi:UPF0489 domain-containing protein [Tribonema minus]|uniref:UPF0489 domain-containing protein n=1 Tax=Tribonema minus TaxID=303371 RepID=A0A835Z3T2_9STRA|nr:UPF0489 domain-containing protein [Tribonema minus]